MEDDLDVEDRKEKPNYDGTCQFCGQTFSKARIATHLRACKGRKAAIAEEAQEQAGAKPGPIMQLSIGSKHNPAYWLHVELASDSTFGALDDFLRHIWLECCGHLSGFRFPCRKPKSQVALSLQAAMIQGSLAQGDWKSLLARAMEPVEEPGDEMDLTLASRVTKGETFDYDYDYGSTTPLTLKVASVREGFLQPDKVTLLARNLPPQTLCDCGQPAIVVCPVHNWDSDGWLCQACAKKHGKVCEFTWSEMLPIVNSPRTGVCAYIGPAERPPSES